MAKACNRTQSPSWMFPWISKSSGNKQSLLPTRHTWQRPICIVSSTDKGHQERCFITTASGDLYFFKKLIQFIGDIGTLSSVGIHFDLFQIVTRGGLFWVIRLTFPLVLEMRRLRLGGEIAQNYLTGGWQRHLGALPPVIFLADRVAYISSANVFSPSLNSTGLSPDRALWKSILGFGKSASPKERWATSRLLKFPVHVVGIRLVGSSPMALKPI